MSHRMYAGIVLLIISIITFTFYSNCSRKNTFKSISDLGTDPLSSLAVYSPKLDGVIDLRTSESNMPNCLNVAVSSNTIDACIFWKSPVDQNNGPLSSVLKFNSQIDSIQNYGVKLEILANQNKLKSDYLNVYSTNTSTTIRQSLSLTNGKFIEGYSNDKSNDTVQIMTFYFLSQLGKQLKTRTNVFWVTDGVKGDGIFKCVNSNISNKINIDVDAYATVDDTGSTVKDNAYFIRPVCDTNGNVTHNANIFLGYAIDGKVDSALHEVAMDSAVAVHEMGHGNAYFSNSSPYQYDLNAYYVYKNSSGNFYKLSVNDIYSLYNGQQLNNYTSIGYKVCMSSQGCIGGIDEGQADFHAFLLFPQNPSVMTTKFNSLIGDSTRNANLNISRSAQQIFNDSIAGPNTTFYLLSGSSEKGIRGEVHDSGSIYASILWQIYTDNSTDKIIFEKEFLSQLSMLSESFDFASARDALLSLDHALFNDRNKTIIETTFKSKGIN